MLEFVQTLARGGIVMVPLGICSIAALTVLIERFIALRCATENSQALMAGIRAAISQGNILGALEKAEAAQGPVARVLATGIGASLAGVSPREAMDEEIVSQAPFLQRWLAVLDTVITIAPLLGLLGTVMGMISSFHILALTATDKPTGITSGIAEALIATATGLVIAICTLVGYNWCQEKIRSIGAEMEKRAAQLAHWLAQMDHMQQLNRMEKPDEVTLIAL